MLFSLLYICSFEIIFPFPAGELWNLGIAAFTVRFENEKNEWKSRQASGDGASNIEGEEEGEGDEEGRGGGKVKKTNKNATE